MINSRRQAAFAMVRWLKTRTFPAELLPDGPDRAFVQDIVYTVIRRLRPLRMIIGEFVRQWPQGELEALLYVGAAQILYHPEIPDFAAVNETVNAAKSSGNPAVAKVVNGVLRNLIRNREACERKLAEAALEVRESFPTAIVRRWTERFGAENAEWLCQWHNRPAETYLARPDGTFVALERGRKVASVPGYAEGEFIVQDPGTRLAVELMDVQPGETVLDACAAPGGKTVQLAWRGAKVTACEINPARRQRLQANLARLRLPVEVISSLDDSRQFRKVLVDAPCSNTGVFRRRPDARWNWSEEKLAELVRLQGEILDLAVSRVAPDGWLVYSTCSNEPEENQWQVESFLSRHPDFESVASREALPFESHCDGAFAAAFHR